MDAAHIHLLLNHVPVIGALFGLLVLAYGLARSSDDVVRTGLWFLVVVGLTSGIVYLTGEPAEELVEGLPGFSHAILERHEAVALWTTVGGAVLGLAALVGLVRYRDRGPPRRYATIMLLLTLGLSGMMGWTANLGGQVMHQEIRPAGAAEVETGTPAAGSEAGEHEDD